MGPPRHRQTKLADQRQRRLPRWAPGVYPVSNVTDRGHGTSTFGQCQQHLGAARVVGPQLSPNPGDAPGLRGWFRLHPDIGCDFAARRFSEGRGALADSSSFYQVSTGAAFLNIRPLRGRPILPFHRENVVPMDDASHAGLLHARDSIAREPGCYFRPYSSAKRTRKHLSKPCSRQGSVSVPPLYVLPSARPPAAGPARPLAFDYYIKRVLGPPLRGTTCSKGSDREIDRPSTPALLCAFFLGGRHPARSSRTPGPS